MIKVVSLWQLPDTITEAEFEAWYRGKHIGDASKIPGLRRYTVNKIADDERAGAPFYRMAELSFDTLKAARSALASPEWQYAAADAKDRLASAVRMFMVSEDVIR